MNELTKTQKHLLELIKEGKAKNGEGLSFIPAYNITTKALIRKGIIEIIESPFCKGNKLIILKK